MCSLYLLYIIYIILDFLVFLLLISQSSVISGKQMYKLFRTVMHIIAHQFQCLLPQNPQSIVKIITDL